MLENDPASYGTSFGTSFEAGAIGNTYILGDLNDPCGAAGPPGERSRNRGGVSMKCSFVAVRVFVSWAFTSMIYPLLASAGPVIMPRELRAAQQRQIPLAPAATTLLQLRFEGNPNGESGETPTTVSGVTYEPGILGSGAYLGPGNQLRYAAASNISATSGTAEFWIKPRWNGNDGQDHYALELGVSGGILIGKDGGNFWRIILNRFGGAGGPELGAGLFVNDWVANQWHYAAFTWGPGAVKVYVDGDLKTTVTPSVAPPSVSATEVQLGADGVSAYIDAAIDEVVISSGERTAEEIRSSFLSGVPVTALSAQPDTMRMFPTWRIAPTLTATTNVGTIAYPAGAATWSSSDSSIAKFDGAFEKIRALAPGQATLTASANGAQAQIVVQVQAPALPPMIETIPSFLASPAQNFLWEIPVVVLRYLPTANGIDLDTSISPDHGTLGPISLADLRAQIDTYDLRVKFGLEEGSRFRAYKGTSRPSLGYRIVKYITVYEPTPPGKVIKQSAGYPVYDADYFSIFERFDIASRVNIYGVKEVWFWSSGFDASYPSYNPAIHRPENFREYRESNMASPVTGDISNSGGDNSDLPVYAHTYTLYGYNFRRTQAEALHNHGHQVEALFAYAATLQDGNSDLFWKKFVGQDATGHFITGRCGWTHMPPNTTNEYEYTNPTLVESDIEDWTPDRIGTLKQVNVDTWGNLVFAWPDGNASFAQRTDTQWYMYWWQSVPGFVNAIRLGTDYMTNWWRFVGSWDASIAAGVGLHSPVPPTAVEESDVEGPAFGLRLGPVFPNPAPSNTSFAIELGKPGWVRVDVVDVQGRRVMTLIDGARPAGRQIVTWDGKANAVDVSSGVYWLVGTHEGKPVARKLVLIR
jgi:hypothetical protein